MKLSLRCALFFVLISVSYPSQAQKLKTIKKSFRSPYSYKLEYDVLKNDKSIKNGIYKKFVNNKLAVAGNYKNNERVDIWQTFDIRGRIYCSYNYSTDKLVHFKDDTDLYKEEGLDNPPILKEGPIVFLTYLYSNLRYPTIAREKNIQGVVEVKLLIDETGNIKNWKIASSDSEELNQAASDAIELIKEDVTFIPARKEGMPVESFYIVPLRFKLS